jgi:hypothetical protein
MDLTSIAIPAMNASESQFVENYYRYEMCKMRDDFLLHPVIKAFLIAVSILWFGILIVFVCMFYKYRALKIRYSRLGEEGGESPSQGGEIEMQTGSN